MKKLSTLLLLLVVMTAIKAQNPFFEVVNYRGAFAPAPATPWTDGWTNWDPQNTSYGTPTVTVSASITTNTTWTSNNVYLIQGLIYVKNGATLTIQPGTVVRGDATIANSSLIITKGSKINAVGTSSNPIVFTSSKDAGSRALGDWGGLIILGKSTVNRVGGVGNIEGIATSTDTEYGGGTSPDDNDNSGNLKYVRIEYGGYVFNTDQEINGLTLGGVGRNTIIDYVQCSFINDDAFEWFGGTVNCSHLVAYRCLDDNFDTDNGYSGSVQFCLGVRDPNISDQSAGSTTEGFESDNDATGSTNTPQTTCVFSNITDISAYRGTVGSLPFSSTFKFRRGARLRRNSGIKILNSILMDAPYGVFIDGTLCRANLQTGVTVFKNNIVAGNIFATEPGTVSTVRDSLFSASKFKNDSLTSTSGLLTTPYDFISPDYRPASGSLALTNVNFDDAAFNGRKIIVSTSSYIKQVNFRGAFAPAPSIPWTEGWTNWDPNNTSYPASNITVTGTITSNTTWTSNNTYKISGLVYVASGVTLTIQPGTIIRGDATVANSALVITKNAKLNAIGTPDQPIVFTSSKDSAMRSIGDWGGVILLGRASLNRVGGVANIEGIASSSLTEYGGGASPNDNDNSGILKYVRIEFGGYVFNTDQEINGLTMGAVGRGTTIDYVQCSFINDDAFEWFGGTVNCSHLVAYRCLDDNFDTDNGYNGCVQFALGVRDPNISDQSAGSTSEGFESDNDAAGSGNTPQTRALFSNVTEIGPFRGTVLSSWGSTFKFRRAARIRRNTGQRLFNSILTDYPYGVFMDGTGVRANLQSGVTKFKNNLIAGCFLATEPGTSSAIRDSIYGSGIGLFKNDSLSSTANVLVNPYDFLNPDYRPGTQPLATTGAAFTDDAFTGLIAPCDPVNTPGAISGNRNVQGCTTPQTYTVPVVSNATSYFWSISGTGATITSGQGTRTITVSYATAFTTCTLSVVGKNDCDNQSAASTISIRKVVLGTPTTFTSNPVRTNVCTMIGTDSTITYSIKSVTGAVSYAWTTPANTTIVAGGTSIDTTITLKFNNGYTTATIGDTLKVVVSGGACQATKLQKLAIKASLPIAPASIIISSITTNVCGSRTYRYTAPALPYGATGYVWSFTGSLGNNAVVDSGSLTSRVFVARYTSNAAATNDDSVKVYFTSNCGNSLIKAAKLSNKLLTTPLKPASIKIQPVVTNICGARQYRYIAPDLPAATTTAGVATGYVWSLEGDLATAGYSIDSGSLSSQKFLITFVSNNAANSTDSVRLYYTSDCGNSAVKALKLTNLLLKAPLAPSSITITRIGLRSCGQPRFRYAAPVTGLPSATTTAGAATGWDWTFTGNLGSQAVIDSGDLQSRVFTVYFTSANPSSEGDSIKVRYNSDCGYGLYKASKLTNTLVGTAVPAAPASVIQTLVADVCGARIYRYTAPVLPAGTTTLSAAYGYEWTLSIGTVGVTGVLDSGSLYGRTILVRYTSNAAAAVNDSIKLRYYSACGESPIKAFKLSNKAFVGVCGGNIPTSRTEENNNNDARTISVLKAEVYPNPNNGLFTLDAQIDAEGNQPALVQIIDMTGRVVKSFNTRSINGSLRMNIVESNLTNGVYVVRYTVGNYTNTIRIVVRK